MSTTTQNPWSGIPEGLGKTVRPNLRVDLFGVTDLLMKHLTPSLCQTVFKQFRDTERERKWSFQAVAQFWTAMIIRQPPSLQNGLEQTRKGRNKDKFFPRVMATTQAFFKKTHALRSHLFQALYEAFLQSLLPQVKPVYASWMNELQKKFAGILLVDGSRLDAVCRRLKLIRHQDKTVLPGCITVFYDLFRGIASQVWFYPDAAEAELPRSQSGLKAIAQETLIVGDRLYASIQYFHELTRLGLYGMFRLNCHLNVKPLETLSRRQGGRTLLEEILVEVGCGVSQPKVTLRLIRYRHHGYRLDLLTNVLDTTRLLAEKAVALYGLRWSVERLFLDLKETLNLHYLYASHPNLVAQQLYATVIVHTAFRISQAHIAAKAKILPEQLSPAKLFPRLAEAARDYCALQWHTIQTRVLNPGAKINLPNLRCYRTMYTWLRFIVAQHRNSKRRKQKTLKLRWTTFAKVRGGPKFLKSLAVH